MVLWISIPMNAITIQLNASNESCPFNGSITVSVSNQTTGTPITYELFLLPNTTTTVQTQQTNVFSALVAGNYRVKVTQVVNGVSNTATEDITIVGVYVPVNFSVTEVKVKCGMDGVLTVNVSAGVPVSYQIISGPVTTGIQTSNVFNNLPVGQYNIKVLDNCGQAFVQTFTLVNIIPSVLINEGSPSQLELPDCGIASLKHGIGFDPNFGINSIFYPLNIEITAFPASGVPIVSTQIITSGLELIFQVPMDANGFTVPYNVKITDVCGNIFTRDNNIVDVKFDFEIPIVQDNCANYYIKFLLENYKSPYTITFINAPSGFIPLNYNPNHPGPFNGDEVQYGNTGNYLPQGIYEVQITDICGNSKIKTFSIGASFEPVSIPVVLDCINGSISISISPPIDLTNVTIVSAPSGYTGVLPQEVSGFINGEGIFILTGIPVGTYVFDLTDACGNFYDDYIVDIPFFQENPIALQRLGCDLGDGSVKIYFANSDIISVEVIEAPSSFGFILPYDVSFNISTEKDFYMNSFPEGLYKFKVKNNCGAEVIVSITIIGYVVDSLNVNVTENCGSFNLYLNQVSNANFFPFFFLQKYNPIEGFWEHPSTGENYIDGQDVNDGQALGGASVVINNAVRILNYQNNLNLAFGNGLYRIVKRFLNYSNGLSPYYKCIESIYEFTYQSGPQLIDVFAFPCANNTKEVVIIASGLGPLLYRVVEKNGQPFIINNTTSNIFSGLDSATYKFEIEDYCGNILITFIDVSLLNPPLITDNNLCNGYVGKLEVQNLSFVTYRWFKTNNPIVTLSTANFLEFNTFNIANDSGTYGVEITSTSSNSCINQTLFYTIDINEYIPNAGADVQIAFCTNNQSIDLNTLLSNPHDSNGVWTYSNGLTLTSTIINPNVLGVGITNFIYTVTGACSNTDAATISIEVNLIPAAPIIISNPTPLCIGNDLQFETPLINGATYFWTGPNGFTSALQNPIINNFQNQNNGDYFLFVTLNGCNSSTTQILISANILPDFVVSGATEICQNQSTVLSVIPSNFNSSDLNITYQWYFNDTLITASINETYEAFQYGTYKVEVNNQGCVNAQEVTITEKLDPFPVLLSQGCVGNDYFVNIDNATTFPNATYSWTGPNGFTSNNQNINTTNFGIGLYEVQVTNELGCVATEQINVARTSCFIPNGLSPNDDGDNDFLDLTGYNVKKLTILNRWGRVVYEKDNYINEWKGQTNNGDLLPTSTYYYIIDYISANENKKVGWIYITY